MRGGSRSDVCVRQPGQVRKEAATTVSGGSAGSFSPFDNPPPTAYLRPMGDSLDIDENEDLAPSAAELEAAGQSALFGAPAEQPALEPVAPPPAAASAVAQ